MSNSENAELGVLIFAPRVSLQVVILQSARFIALLDYPGQTLLEILMGRQIPADLKLEMLASEIRSAAATA